MSWECKYLSGGECNKLGGACDPGRRGCVLHGKVFFPFMPEKNPSSMNREPETDSGEPADDPKPGRRPSGDGAADR